MPPRARGKFSKPSRGGGKHFSRDLQPLDKDGNAVGLWRDPEDQIGSSSDGDDDDDDDEDDSSEDGGAAPQALGGTSTEGSMTREQRRAAAKAKKQAAAARKNQVVAQPGDLPPTDSEEEQEQADNIVNNSKMKKKNKAGEERESGHDGTLDAELPANPNHTAKSRSQLQKDPGSSRPPQSSDTSQLSRREREAIEAQQARERYLKLHAEGKTDEARADLARLAIVRERREAERLRKEAEKAEKEERDRERNAAKLAREQKMREAALGPKKAKSGTSKN